MNDVLDNLKRLGVLISAAEEVQLKALASAFPLGTQCSVKLMYGQINPSPATIAGWQSSKNGGLVIVEIDNKKAKSRYPFRLISPCDVQL
jgi:hypothetical protein